MKKGNIIGLTGQGNIAKPPGKVLERLSCLWLGRAVKEALHLEVTGYIEPWHGLVGPDGRRPVRRSGILMIECKLRFS